MNTSEQTRIVLDLMAIPARPGRETAVADYIVKQLRGAGVPPSAIRRDRAHRQSPIGGDCGNLFVVMPGSPGRTGEPRRLLSAHMDTVPPAVGCKPIKRGTRILNANPTTALGGDDRSGCAAILSALLTLRAEMLSHPPLTVLWTIQEEVGLFGARFVDPKTLARPAMGFNFDGADPACITLGATGAYRMTITVRGLASHAGVSPERGVSATAIAALAIADLQNRGWHGLIRKGGKRGTSNVGVIHGGDATNVVTDLVTLRAEARSHDRALRKRIVREYRAAFTRAARSVRSSAGKRGKVRFDVRMDYDSFRLDPAEPCVAAARRAVKAAGLRPTPRVANGGLDANWLVRHGVPTVTLGSGQRDIHSVKEWLHLPDYHHACAVALQLARGEKGVGRSHDGASHSLALTQRLQH